MAKHLLLAIDVGNTNTVFALYRERHALGQWRISTMHERTADEYAAALTQLMALKGYSQVDVGAAVISSVVPQALPPLKSMCREFFNCTARVVGEDLGVTISVVVGNPAGGGPGPPGQRGRRAQPLPRSADRGRLRHRDHVRCDRRGGTVLRRGDCDRDQPLARSVTPGSRQAAAGRRGAAAAGDRQFHGDRHAVGRVLGLCQHGRGRGGAHQGGVRRRDEGDRHGRAGRSVRWRHRRHRAGRSRSDHGRAGRAVLRRSAARSELKGGRMPEPELLFVPLGGAGEIGLNLNLYRLDDQWLMVDLGLSFADETLPGVEIVLPDPSFIAERRESLCGLILTHAHEDHFGALPYLWERLRCPIYCTRFTAAVLRPKLEEAGVRGAVLNVVTPGERFMVGPFDCSLLRVTHSIPESHALALRTPLGNVLHTGDWKLDPAPLIGPLTATDELEAFGREGVLAMVADSTNILNHGTSGSEAEVRDSLQALIAGLPNRVVLTTFASNIARLETAIRVAEAVGRPPAAGRPPLS